MERNFVPTLGTRAPRGDLATADFTPEELKANRVRGLLEDVKKDQLIKEATKRLSDFQALMKVREEVQKKHPHSAYVAGITEDGPVYEVLIEAPPKLVELMDARPFLTTLPMWCDVPEDRRRAVLAEYGLDPDLAMHTDIMRVLPEASLRFLADWQKQINSGGSWQVSLSIGQMAENLIEYGYLMHAPEEQELFGVDDDGDPVSRTQPGRGDVTPGRPGSPGFVRAMMGETYLTWLLANERE